MAAGHYEIDADGALVWIVDGKKARKNEAEVGHPPTSDPKPPKPPRQAQTAE